MGKMKAVIFDLDDTLVNTSQLKQLRRNPWRECYAQIPNKTFFNFDKKLMSLINQNSYKVGIVTNSPRPYATRVLTHHEFDYHNMVAYHDCVNRKPHPESMFKCALNLGVHPKEVITIGDSVNDIVAAKSAGMVAIGVTWGESSEEDLLSANPDYVLRSETEVIEILKGL